MTSKTNAFVAYGSKDPTCAKFVEDAVSRANALPISFHYEPWIFNDVSGEPLISPILEKIDDSALLVADITHLNLNVVYEVGFAIGKQKKVFLIRHKGTPGDLDLAKEAGIFDTLGYFEYEDGDHLKERLTSHISTTPLSFAIPVDQKAPVYIVDHPAQNAQATMMVSRIKKAGYRFRSFSPSEDIRLSATDAIRQIAASAGIVGMLQGPTAAGSAANDVRVLFAAGLAHGMGKPALLLASKDADVPLDIRDEVEIFDYPDDIPEHVAGFCPEVNTYAQGLVPLPIETTGLLENLSVGDPTAENEMTTLGNYFLQTNEYQRAVRGEVNLVVGRKGSGKTALFIEVRDKIRSDKRNIVVDLKPEGYQLLKLKEEILEYLSEGVRQHVVIAFWEYLILLEVTYKLLEKDRHTHKYNHEIRDLYLELDRAYRVEGFSAEGDFSERLLTLSERIAAQYKEQYGTEARRLSADQVTRLLYAHDMRQLRDLVSRYLSKKQAVWVLFDNLDKGWSTRGVDATDALVVRSLIDAGHKIDREMAKAGHIFHCIVFVRNDVYEHLMQNSSDYGKEMRAVLDWTDPDMLREMLKLRLVAGLGGDKAGELSFEQVWRTVCSPQVRGEESSSYVIARSLMRPRNVLKIFNHARGFATNFHHAHIEEEDIEKGLKAYSQDLIIELDRELSDVAPETHNVLYHFIDAPTEITEDLLRSLLLEAGVSKDHFEKVVDFLLYYGVLGVRVDKTDYFIFDVNYDLNPLKIRAKRAGASARYVFNPAFWPALSVQPSADLFSKAGPAA